MNFAQLDAMRQALAECTMPPGSAHKRFARSVIHRPIAEMTERQRRHIIRLAWRYRRQMPRHLVPSKDAVEAIDAGWRPVEVGGVTVYTRSRPRRPGRARRGTKPAGADTQLRLALAQDDPACEHRGAETG